MSGATSNAMAESPPVSIPGGPNPTSVTLDEVTDAEAKRRPRRISLLRNIRSLPRTVVLTHDPYLSLGRDKTYAIRTLDQQGALLVGVNDVDVARQIAQEINLMRERQDSTAFDGPFENWATYVGSDTEDAEAIWSENGTWHHAKGKIRSDDPTPRLPGLSYSGDVVNAMPEGTKRALLAAYREQLEKDDEPFNAAKATTHVRVAAIRNLQPALMASVGLVEKGRALEADLQSQFVHYIPPGIHQIGATQGVIDAAQAEAEKLSVDPGTGAIYMMMIRNFAQLDTKIPGEVRKFRMNRLNSYLHVLGHMDVTAIGGCDTYNQAAVQSIITGRSRFKILPIFEARQPTPIVDPIPNVYVRFERVKVPVEGKKGETTVRVFPVVESALMTYDKDPIDAEDGVTVDGQRIPRGTPKSLKVRVDGKPVDLKRMKIRSYRTGIMGTEEDRVAHPGVYDWKVAQTDDKIEVRLKRKNALTSKTKVKPFEGHLTVRSRMDEEGELGALGTISFEGNIEGGQGRYRSERDMKRPVVVAGEGIRYNTPNFGVSNAVLQAQWMQLPVVGIAEDMHNQTAPCTLKISRIDGKPSDAVSLDYLSKARAAEDEMLQIEQDIEGRLQKNHRDVSRQDIEDAMHRYHELSVTAKGYRAQHQGLGMPIDGWFIKARKIARKTLIDIEGFGIVYVKQDLYVQNGAEDSRRFEKTDADRPIASLPHDAWFTMGVGKKPGTLVGHIYSVPSYGELVHAGEFNFVLGKAETVSHQGQRFNARPVRAGKASMYEQKQ